MKLQGIPPSAQRIWMQLALCACLLSAWAGAFAQSSAAKVMAISGSATVTDAQGRTRQLEKGAELRPGERIVTTQGALIQIRLNDGGYMSIRSSTEMVIDRFVYDEKEASKSSFLVSLIKGGFRSITGLIGRTNPNAYQIRTPTATLGVRGTDHEPMYIPEGVPGMAALGAPGVYDKVNDGESFIQNKGGILAIKRGEIGFAPVQSDKAPALLQKVPDFYKVDVKTDARDPKDAAESKGDGSRRAAATGGLLRPSTAARRDLINAGGDPGLLRPNALGVMDPAATTPLAPVPSTTLVAPTTLQLAPSTTLIAPTTQLAPSTTLIAPSTTLIAPTTTQISPSTTLIAPSTLQIAPSSTLTAPATTTIQQSTQLK
jgi:hypothetical protein